VYVHSLYSRLLCDVNRSPASETIFRTVGDSKKIELNQDLTDEEEEKRLKKYHTSYFHAFRNVSKEIDPHYIVSVHTFTPCYEGSIRKEEVGVLTSLCDDIGDKFLKEFQNKGYKAFLNEPWSGKNGLNFAIDNFLTAKYPFQREGIVLEFRNDLLKHPETFRKIQVDLQDIIRSICLK